MMTGVEAVQMMKVIVKMEVTVVFVPPEVILLSGGDEYFFFFLVQLPPPAMAQAIRMVIAADNDGYDSVLITMGETLRRFLQSKTWEQP